MPTIEVNVVSNRDESIKTIKSKREKAIDFNVITLAKSGTYGTIEFIGTEKDTGKLCFKRTNGDIVVLGLWALVQRPEATEPKEYAPEFTLGVLKGLQVKTDVVIDIVDYLWDNIGTKYTFAESKAKTISYRKTDGTFALRADSTDLILMPAEPAKSKKTKKSKKD